MAYELAQGIAQAFLERVDEELMGERGEGLGVVGFKEKLMITTFGEVRIKRRAYRDADGRMRYLLDEALGLEKRSPLSPGIRELCALFATELSFAKCEELLSKVLPSGVSHTTIHRLVGKMTDPQLAEEDKEVKKVFEEGATVETGKRKVPHLFVESDGVSIALQRERERRGEIKVGIAYEGWQGVGGEGRHRLLEKTSYLGMMDGDRFWEGFSLTLVKKYDLGSVGHIVVGGDGARWVREGVEMLGASYQLDRFHLRRALLRGLRGDMGLAEKVYRACIKGEVMVADKLLMQEQARCDTEQAWEMAQLRGYLLDNAWGLKDYRLNLDLEGLRGLGAIEGNVDKLVATRMKKRGMSWTKRGAKRMSRLLQMRHSNELAGCAKLLKCPVTTSSTAAPQPKKSRKKHGYDATWLNMALPALEGPHQNRPWTQTLKRLSKGITTSGFKPTFP